MLTSNFEPVTLYFAIKKKQPENRIQPQALAVG
jgi:hypothetical protein